MATGLCPDPADTADTVEAEPIKIARRVIGVQFCTAQLLTSASSHLTREPQKGNCWGR